eukprot:GHVP01049089.1.p1 GENE.GHVP01049089.1~~GHVP01049089.1.p1  ORF type:complete len:282 (+),score=52.35 GHVP01049089.1:68-847(+)
MSDQFLLSCCCAGVLFGLAWRIYRRIDWNHDTKEEYFDESEVDSQGRSMVLSEEDDPHMVLPHGGDVQPKQPDELAPKHDELSGPEFERLSFEGSSECDSNKSPQTPQSEPVKKTSPIVIWVCPERSSDSQNVSEAPVPARAETVEEPSEEASRTTDPSDLPSAVWKSKAKILSDKKNLVICLNECEHQIYQGELRKKFLQSANRDERRSTRSSDDCDGCFLSNSAAIKSRNCEIQQIRQQQKVLQSIIKENRRGIKNK